MNLNLNKHLDNHQGYKTSLPKSNSALTFNIHKPSVEHVSSNGFNDEKNDIEAATYLYHKEKEEKKKEKKKEKEKEEAEEEEEEDINDKCLYLILDWSKPLEQSNFIFLNTSHPSIQASTMSHFSFTDIQSWKADDRDVLSSVDLIIASDGYKLVTF